MKRTFQLLFVCIGLAFTLSAQTVPKLALTKGFPKYAETMDVSSDNDLVAVTDPYGLYIFKLDSGEQIQALLDIKDSGPTLFAANNDLYVIGSEGVTLISAETLTVTKQISIPALASYWMSADRTELFVTGMRVNRPTIWRIDTANGRARPVYTDKSDDAAAIDHISLAPEKELALIRTTSGTTTLLKTGRRWASAKVLSSSSTHSLAGILPNGNIVEVLREGKDVKGLTLKDPIKGQLVNTLPFDQYAPNSPVILPKHAGSPIVFKEVFGLLLIDPKTGVISQRIPKDELRPGAAALFDHDRQIILQSNSTHGITTLVIDLDSSQLLSQLEDETFKISQVLGHPQAPIVYASTGVGVTKIIRIENGRLNIHSKQVKAGDSLSINAAGTQVHISQRGGGLSDSHSFETYDLDMRELQQTMQTRSALGNRFYSLEGYVFSESGAYCFLTDQRNSRMINQSGSVLWEKDKVSFRKQTVYIDEVAQRIYIDSKAYDLKTGALLFQINETPIVTVLNQRTGEWVSIEETGGQQSSENGTRTVKWFAAKNGQKLREQTTDHHNFDRYLQSPDGQMLAAIDDNRLVVFDTEGLRILASIEHENVRSITSLSKLSFFNNNQSLVSIGRDSTLLFWDLVEQKFLATLQLLEDDNEWLVYDESGRYDAPVATQEKLNFAINLSLVPLTAYSENYFRPQLLSDLLNHRTVTMPQLNLAELSTPPEIKLTAIDSQKQVIDGTSARSTSAQLTLNVAAASNGSPITEIRIFQNGKRVSTATRGLSVVDDDEPEDSPSYDSNETFAVSLLPGENTFEVVAMNAQRIESVPSQLTVNYDAPANKKTTLHLLAIGVNDYQNEKYNLNYAVADASAFKDKVNGTGAALFDHVSTNFMKNSEVTKTAIKQQLQKITDTAAPQDVFIFYYAGHGVVADQGKGDFYIVPTDVTQLYGADEQLATRGLSSRELQELSQSIPAQKQLFILDACQSAGALTGLSQRGAAEEKAIAQLARSTGTHWLTASGSQQFATEFTDLGHGAFTYTLLNGLQGEADTGDGRVTVNELKAYLESTVPEVTAKYKGTAQYPASYGYGQDFPITLP